MPFVSHPALLSFRLQAPWGSSDDSRCAPTVYVRCVSENPHISTALIPLSVYLPHERELSFQGTISFLDKVQRMADIEAIHPVRGILRNTSLQTMRYSQKHFSADSR